MPVIEVLNVHKSFRVPSVQRTTVREHIFAAFRPRMFDTLEVLRGVDFELRQGETLGLMGANGCGKSTLLKIISGIYTPDSGRVKTAAAITPILELGVGWNGELNAVDNVYLIGALMGLSLGELRSSMEEILSFAELEKFARLELKHFSSGMASRLAYAVAFRAAREVLILDEVFAVGDAGFKKRCEDRYRQLRAEGRSVLIVSHDVRIISTFCDRALFLSRGRIAAAGAPRDVADQYLASLTESSEPVHESSSLSGAGALQ